MALTDNPMTRLLHLVPALLMLTLPTLAEDFRTIGLIEAEFDGEALSQATMSYLDGDKRLATASLTTRGGTTTLTIQGAEGKPIVIEAMFGSAAPGAQSTPSALEIGFFPDGMRSFWTSGEAPEPARITFDRLDTEADDLHASGTFEALLCLVSDEADTGNCRPIAGRFDTDLLRE